MKTTTKTTMTISMIALIVAMAIVTQSQTVDAWHSKYPTKKDCVHFRMDINLESLSEAQDSCKNDIPH